MKFYWRTTFAALTLGLMGALLLTGATWADDKADKEIIHLQNPLGSTEITTIAGRAIFAAMGIMGSLALVVFVYGGFRWLTAAGNAESVKEGTQAMVWAAIGIFVIFSSYAILQLVFQGIGVSDTPTNIMTGCYCGEKGSGTPPKLMPVIVSEQGCKDLEKPGKLSCTWHKELPGSSVQ